MNYLDEYLLEQVMLYHLLQLVGKDQVVPCVPYFLQVMSSSADEVEKGIYVFVLSSSLLESCYD